MNESLMLLFIFSSQILRYHNLWFVDPSANSLFAYIGPGMGGGVIAAIFGIIAAFFLGLWGILYYPIKRAFKNKNKNKNKNKMKILSKNKNQNRK